MTQSTNNTEPLPWWKENISLLLHFSICFFWIFTLPRHGQEYKYEARSIRQLTEIKTETLSFIKTFKRTPVNLRELYVFSSDHAIFSLYDALGQRLDYLPLSNTHFLLRNYGIDGLSNTINSTPDKQVGNYSFSEKRGFSKAKELNPFWSLPLPFASTQIVPGKIQAKIFVNENLKTRFLLAQTLSPKGESRIFTFPHDQVDQFILVEEGSKIIFVGTGSERYGDGIYLWDLKSNETINLVTPQKNGESFRPESSPWVIQLAGIVPKYNAIAAFMSQDLPLIRESPFSLYQKENLFFWDLKSKAKVMIDSPNLDFMLKPEVPLQKTYALLTAAGSNQLWLDLYKNTTPETAMASWTKFCQETGQDELLHYHCLFHLSVLYSESSLSETLLNSIEEKDRLRAYAAQLSYQLARAPGTPLFLRFLGNDLYQHFMSNTPIVVKYFPPPQ